jgi:acetyltransferase-like isoleucine patch superfamily enzyme
MASIGRLLRDPRAYSWVPEYALARARGGLYRLRAAVGGGGRLRVGRGVVAECPVHIEGPGRVTIGDGCLLRRSNATDVHIRTLAPEATVEIGEGATLGGVLILCRRAVRIGARTLAANCRIQDVDFASADASAGASPVEIGEQGWLGIESVLLPGARLGRNVIVAAGAVVSTEIPDGSTALGNPARATRLSGPALQP